MDQEDQDIAASAAQRVYLDLRRRIVDLTLLPASRIVERDIATAHQTSRTPVREAVLRLADEGLVEIVQRVGTFVAKIPLDQLEEATFMRTALETAVIAQATLRMTPAAAQSLQALLDAQRACVAAGDPAGFHRLDEQFHQHLTTLAGVPGVWRVIDQVKTQVDRFRRFTLPIPGRMEVALAEHDAMLAAMLSHRVEEACQTMRGHLQHVLEVIKVARLLNPDYFSQAAPGLDPGNG